ncbi:MAG: hypothetical protein CMB76_05255 [Euryarchaeota archaeon]|nr:hypothetical protein [Euryarchaeota archaeon]|tara:strand:+ start:3793 stop:4392 length:600 start_codon:yes stop_codon:yes gene_type:complete
MAFSFTNTAASLGGIQYPALQAFSQVKDTEMLKQQLEIPKVAFKEEMNLADTQLREAGGIERQEIAKSQALEERKMINERAKQQQKMALIGNLMGGINDGDVSSLLSSVLGNKNDVTKEAVQGTGIDNSNLGNQSNAEMLGMIKETFTNLNESTANVNIADVNHKVNPNIFMSYLDGSAQKQAELNLKGSKWAGYAYPF